MTQPRGWDRAIARRPEDGKRVPERESIFTASGEIDDAAFWRWIDTTRRETFDSYGPVVGENMMQLLFLQIGGLDEYRERYGLEA